MVHVVYVVTASHVYIGWTRERARAQLEYDRVHSYSPPTVRTIGMAKRRVELDTARATLATMYPHHRIETSKL